MSARRRFFAVILSVGAAAPAAAAPVITGSSGTYTHGASVRITGTGFGTKPSVAPVLETFESGSFNPYWSATPGLTIQTAQQRSSLSTRNAHHDFKNGTSDDVHNAYMTGSDSILSPTWFVSYWFYLAPNFDWQDGGYPNPPKFLSNVKLFRLWHPGSSPEDILVNTHGWENSVTWEVESTGEPTHYFLSNYATSALAPGAWHHLQFAFKENTSPGSADGQFYIWVDGAGVVADTSVITKLNPSFNVNKRPKNVGFYNSWSPNEGTPDPSDAAPNDYYMDDAYVDTSWQRVELGDASTYSACVHREMQPMTAWSDTAIDIQVNAGSFLTGQQAYLFVVDANGVVNNAGIGLPLTVDGGSSTPPPPPPPGPTGSGAGPANVQPDRRFFNPGQSVTFGAGAVEVVVTDLDGRRLVTLTGPAGAIAWDGKDAAGRMAESGLYICRIKDASGKSVYQTVMLVR